MFNVAALLYGLAMVGGAFLAPVLGEALLQVSYSVLGVAGGPLTALFMMGFLVPFANKWVNAAFMIGMILTVETCDFTIVYVNFCKVL